MAFNFSMCPGQLFARLAAHFVHTRFAQGGLGSDFFACNPFNNGLWPDYPV